MARKPAITFVYVYRGPIERGSARGYVWRDGYSETMPDGGICYPWLTKAQCRADAKARGGKALFFRSETEVAAYFA